MRETFTNITAGLVVAVVVIFLLLAANFQSLRLAFVVVSTVPAVLAGVVLMLARDADDAERAVVHGRDHGDRRRGRERDPARDVRRAGRAGTAASPLRRRHRRRAGPDASGADDQRGDDRRHDARWRSRSAKGREATAPLGRAVIGGLAAATVATLIVLPSVYSLVQQSARVAIAVAGSRRSGERLSRAGSTHEICDLASARIVALLLRGARCGACRGDPPPPARSSETEPARPRDRGRSAWSSKPLNVTLSLPGELEPYQTVASTRR